MLYLQSQNVLNSGWSSGDEISAGPHLLFGFAEDYKNVLLKCKHELVLMLTRQWCLTHTNSVQI